MVDAQAHPYTCMWHKGRVVMIVVPDVVRLSMCKTVANAIDKSTGGTLCQSQEGMAHVRKKNSIMCGLRSACIEKGRECGPYVPWSGLDKPLQRNIRRVTNQVVGSAMRVVPELKSSLAASSFRNVRCKLPAPEFGCGQYYTCACFRSAKGIKPVKHIDKRDVGLSCIITMSPQQTSGKLIKKFYIYVREEFEGKSSQKKKSKGKDKISEYKVRIRVPNGSAIFMDSRNYMHKARAKTGTYTMVLYNKETLMDTTYKLVM